MDQAASVVIVDNDGALCELLRGRLDDEPGLTCVGTATGAEGAKTLVEATKPHVIILDFGLGSGVDAIDLVSRLVTLSPSSQVLIWTKWTDPSVEHAQEILWKLRAIRNGASDWISKGDGIDTLVGRIREAVRRGSPPTPPDNRLPTPIELSLTELIGHVPPRKGTTAEPVTDYLTPAERRVAQATARGLEDGLTIERIARMLNIKIQTLRTHLRSIYSKWNVHSQAAFVTEARRRGLC